MAISKVNLGYPVAVDFLFHLFQTCTSSLDMSKLFSVHINPDTNPLCLP